MLRPALLLCAVLGQNGLGLLGPRPVRKAQPSMAPKRKAGAGSAPEPKPKRAAKASAKKAGGAAKQAGAAAAAEPASSGRRLIIERWCAAWLATACRGGAQP